MPKPAHKKPVPPAQSAPPANLPWEVRHILLILLPGVAFSLVYYIVLRIAEGNYVPVQKRWPKNYQEWSEHYLDSTLWSIGAGGVTALILCIVAAVVLTKVR